MRVPLPAPLAILGLAIGAIASACSPPVDVSPSILLVVIDTLRADAVSAYGAVEGTTPFVDSLAAAGLRYQRAYAPSPWTLPSHATLFTGLWPERHGVGVGGRMLLPEGLPTLAERMGQAGYETVGFSENPIVGSALGFDRGFAHFEGQWEVEQARRAGRPVQRWDVVDGVAGWAQQRSPERPFFLFVNLFGPHDPYALHDPPTHLPPGASVERARKLGRGPRGQGIAEYAGICDRLPEAEELAILRGLYLGEVAAADARLGAIHAAAAAAAAAAQGALISVVTSDHGEHLGEHGLLGHQFSLRNALLRVPLVVTGLPEAGPAVIDAPVALADLAPSLLDWAGLEPLPEAAGRVLPLSSEPAPAPRALPALYADQPVQPPEGLRTAAREIDRRRRSCRPDDRVYGDILSLIRFPYKLIWYENHAPQLYDLRWDDQERSDVALHHPEHTLGMTRELEAVRRRLEERASAGEPEPITAEAFEALEALGYVE